VRWHQGRLIARFDGVDDRDVAEALRGVLLQVDSATVGPPDDPDEFLDHQLVGLRVEAPDGTLLGSVDTRRARPGSDLIVLAKAGGGTALVTVRQPPMIPTVDLAGGRMIADLPEGLLGPLR
jgi:16S rRNA processing protein RimM